MCTGIQIGTRLIRNRTGNRLTDPIQVGIGRELVTTTVFKLVHRFHQTDVAFLNQVKEPASRGWYISSQSRSPKRLASTIFFGTAGFRFTNRHTLEISLISITFKSVLFNISNLLLECQHLGVLFPDGLDFAGALGNLPSSNQAGFDSCSGNVIRNWLQSMRPRRPHPRIICA